ncbi:MAG: DUF4065 domain-containing protein [Synergistaceae bacterium]|jgi:uncharacterized phage-associated protein|nr:DUF4065 domain-containing protein [Synergistaceae bacterium]
MIDVLDLAGYLLYLNREEAEQAGDEAVSSIDPMKLQKLLFYCQGYSLALTGEPLFEDPIEAWQYGPVVRKVYKRYQKYRGSYLPLNLVETPPPLNDCAASIARLVMRDKGKFSAAALMKMTHEEPSWQEARQKEKTACGYNPFACELLSLKKMRQDFEKDLTAEMSDEEEKKLWNSAGREPTEEEWKEIALSI